jgi:hypothetical protein
MSKKYPPGSHDDLHHTPGRDTAQYFPLRALPAQRSTLTSAANPSRDAPSHAAAPSASSITTEHQPGATATATAPVAGHKLASPAPTLQDQGHASERLLEDSEANCEPQPADGRLGKMSKAPLLLRTSPGFGTGSYGAAPFNPELDGTDGAEDISYEALSRRSEDSSSRNRSRTRRRKSTSSNRSEGVASSSALSIPSQERQSQGFGGSVVVGGLEGRLVTETSLGSETSLDSKVDHSVKDGGHSQNRGDAGDDYEDDSTEGDELSELDENDPPDNSPYAQVRASVAPTDNITLSINTPRMWTLSTLFAILGSSTNLFFSLRYPSVAITPVIALLLVHPLGLLWDLLLKRQDDPPEEFVDGVRTTASQSAANGNGRSTTSKTRRVSQRFRLWLSQGRWNEKEHSCVYISSNVSFGFAFATDVIVEQTQFYKQDASIIYQLLLTLSTQILGYAFAGLTRRFLVRPSGMIWPGTLMSAAMFTTLHKEENKTANGWRLSRWKFFYIVWTGAFLFYFLPGLLMPALSYFNVITWFAPNNVVVANLFGVVSGLGLFPLTFDWAQIAYIGSPLLTPFWAAMNVVGGLVIVMWIIAPIAYYMNWFHSSYMPMLSASVFDNTGKIYDVSRILTPEFLFDREAYSSYSRVFLPITYVLSYGLQFAGLASLLTHTFCWHGSDIWNQWKRSLEEAKETGKVEYEPLATESTGMSPISPSFNGTLRAAQRSTTSFNNDLFTKEDVHNRLMRRYKDAPLTWYLLTAATMLAIGIFVVE